VRRFRWRWVVLVEAMVLAVVAAGPTGAQERRDPASGRLRRVGIEHVIVVMLENATFDHVFGTYPGVDGLSQGQAVFEDRRGRKLRTRGLTAADLGRDGSFPIDEGEEALTNGAGAARTAYAGGEMDGFARAQSGRHHAPLALRHYRPATAPKLWELARQNVVFDRFFSSFMGDSLPNLLHLVAGSSRGILQGNAGTLRRLWKSRFPTIFDSAQAHGVSWKYYVGGLENVEARKLLNGAYFTEERTSTRPSQLYWAPVLSIRRFWSGPAMRRGVVEQRQFFRDAARGTLPAISYVLPVPNTHWPTRPEQSQGRILSLVNALKKSPQWHESAIFLVWDDWGGFYDHVPPPRVSSLGLGFRLPALLVSPRAKHGYISHAVHDHTSIPEFIARGFGIRPVGGNLTSGSFGDVWTRDPAEGTVPVLNTTHRYQASGAQYGNEVFNFYKAGVAVVLALVGLFGWRRARARSRIAPSAAPVNSSASRDDVGGIVRRRLESTPPPAPTSRNTSAR
jgi:phospholipase C